MITESYLDTHNFAIITLDSLRYDVSVSVDIPKMRRWFEKYGTHPDFVKTYAPGTYTLPSHISMFVAGIFPENRTLGGYYNRYSQSMIRTTSVEVKGKRNGINFDSRNIIEGFAAAGFRTIGIGGVGWFDNSTPAAKYLTNMFSEFHYNQSFHESNPKSIQNQVELFRRIYNPQQKTLLFLNISSTHHPYCGFSEDMNGQRAALEFIDPYVDQVMETLAAGKPLFSIVCADHGEVFGLGGKGHGFYHPKVMEVPMMVIDTAERADPETETDPEMNGLDYQERRGIKKDKYYKQPPEQEVDIEERYILLKEKYEQLESKYEEIQQAKALELARKLDKYPLLMNLFSKIFQKIVK